MSEHKKLLTLIWRRTNLMELGKDVVLLPYNLGLALGYRTEILCGYADGIEDCIHAEENENLKFVRRWITYNPCQRILIYMKYLFQNSSRIDLLMCFHWRFETFAVILLHRLFNKNGQIYVKLDTSTGIEWDLSYRSFIGKTLRRWVYNSCLKKVDLFSCETSHAYRNLCGNKDFGAYLKPKLVILHNAFDEFRLKDIGLEERSYSRKENLMITVGRLGTCQKNTEMQLNALADMDLKEWRFCFIGPIEDTFQPVISDFFSRHPEKKGKVEFVGPLYDKKALWEYYNKAKVFVCTSRWEGSCIVLSEAKRFRNYIVSTRVGEAEDLVEQEKYGTFINQEDVSGLRGVLTHIIDREKNIDVYQNYDTKELSYQERMKALVSFLSCR